MWALRVFWSWDPRWRLFGLYESPEQAQVIADTCCAEASAFAVEGLA